MDNRGSINWDAVLTAITAYFAGDAISNWQRQFSVPMYDLMSDMIKMLDKELEWQTPITDILTGQWFTEHTIKFAQPINATSELAIRQLIEQGIMDGWSIPTTQKHLKTLFEQWMGGSLTPDMFEWLNARMPEFRRELIARTETIKAANATSYKLYGYWGVEQHEWLSTMDDRVRDAHAAANGQIVQVGMPFKVGGESLLYPGDPAGSAGNVINCRCTTIPVV